MSLAGTLRALPRPVAVVCLATFVNRAGTMALPFLVIYLTHERHLSAERAGAVLAAYGAGALVAGPLGGWLVGRTSARAAMVGSLAGSALSLLALTQVTAPIASVGLVIGWAICAESFRPAAAAVVAEHVEPAGRRNAYAVLRLAVNLGMAVGPAAGGLMAERSYGALFVTDAATSFAAAGLLLSPAGRPLGAHLAQASRTVLEPLPKRARAALTLHLLGVALVAIVAYQALSTMPLYMTGSLALGESAYGFVFGLSGLLIVLFEVPLTVWLERWSHRRLLVCGAALTGLGFAALGIAGSLYGVILTTFVWTTGEMLLGPATSARVADLEPAGRRGVFVGLHNGVWSAAFAAGPWLGLQLFARVEPRLHWALVGLVGLAAAAVFSLGGESRKAAS